MGEREINMKNKKALFLQVRLNSSRMNGKALANLQGKKLIQYTIESMNGVNCDLKILLTTKEAKKYLSPIAKYYKWKIFYGDKNNVLKRFVDVADLFNVDTIIRATGDNPLLSSEIANETIELFEKNNVDICHLSNVPYGSGVEVIKAEALKKVIKSSEVPYHLEHVTPYIYENKDKFKILISDPNERFITRKDVKISVDSREDLERVSHLIRNIKNSDYSIKNVINIYDKLNFNKYKRILLISDNYDNEIITKLYDKLSSQFEFYLLKKNSQIKNIKRIIPIEYEDLDEFIKHNGIFERIILDIGNTTENQMNYYKSMGFIVSINDEGIGKDLSDLNVSIKYNDRYNFNKFDTEKDIEELSDSIANLSIGLNYCPHCSCKNDKPVARTKLWNMFYCKECKLYYITPFKEYNDIYVDRYFTDEYKEQYGKTYEEDKPNILKFAEKRLNVIKKYKNKGKILDFGCGLGFFSELCQNNGFESTSVDISDYAINYIKSKLNLSAYKGDLTFFEKNNEKYDIITSFYVIEHIKDFEKMIFMFNKHLNHNGVIALSTPNASGVSVKFNFSEYYKVHPKDHYRIFSHKFLKKILLKNGFCNVKIVSTGIHPERFVKKKNLSNKSFLYKMIYSYMIFFKLGDTFEIYAQKK